jgi:hypothetical protein
LHRHVIQTSFVFRRYDGKYRSRSIEIKSVVCFSPILTQ